jgi:hypothetical protein
MVEPFDLFDAHTVVDTRAAGGFLQDGEEATTVVFVETDVVPVGEDGPVTTLRLVVDLDHLFALVAKLEHAGKTALMMPL